MSQAWSFPLCSDPRSPTLDWEGLLTRFEWLRAMEGCPQDPVYHAEGDVLTHTRLTCEALVADDEWRRLDEETRSVLFAAVLLHDVAKPTSIALRSNAIDVESGQITSPGHSSKGARMTQQILYQDWPSDEPLVPFHIRQQIVALVRYHGLPLWFWDRASPDRTVIEVSLKARCDQLALLARADVLGRHGGDRQELLARVDLFRDFCEEKRCLRQPRPFPSDHSRFLYFWKPGRSPDYEAYDDTRLEAVMMSGLPGAGKDYWIDRHLRDWPIISLDELRSEMKIRPGQNQGPVVARARELARGYLREGQSFVWNATNITRATRRGLIDLFVAYRARIRIIYVEVPWPELMRRNQSRGSPVPTAVISRLAKRLEVPDLTEAHRVAWVTALMDHGRR